MGKSNLRKPAVAGQFYPSSRQELKKQIEAFIPAKAEKIDAIACILPHAGYIYSGRVAAETVSRLIIKDTVILLGPNHTGYGTEFSIMTQGSWQTPLGEIKIESGLASRILKNSEYLKDDNAAHLYEHSLEVELPFLQYFKTDFKIVPIVIASSRIEALKAIGKTIASTVVESKLKGSVLMVASSDMTHYEPQGEAERKDKQAIEAIIELNEDKLFERIRKLDISMCGYAPVIAMIAAAKALGAKTAQLIKYQTSGDVTGDKTSVVGYAGLILT